MTNVPPPAPDVPTDTATTEKPKLPYNAPQLTEYGNMVELTGGGASSFQGAMMAIII